MSNRLDTLSPEAQAFLGTVRHHLSDLPAGDQADLVEQVEQRLHDLDASGEADAIATYLGGPNDLADDIRAAAGFAAAPAAAAAIPASARPNSSFDMLRAVAQHPALRPAVDYFISLRPAWWAIRGYILVAGVLAAMTQGGGYRLHILGYYSQASMDTAPIHSLAWVLVPTAAVVASIALGKMTIRLAPSVRLLVAALNIVAVAVLIAYPTWWLAPAFAYYSGLVT